jgi:transcriptional regulator with XRE-family HTH domain
MSPVVEVASSHMASRAFGDYLKARRALVRPSEVGLSDGPRRRVTGLRRTEVSLLAGISTEYYIRLEQGHGHHPSTAVLDGLARALQLDKDAREYLHRLAALNSSRIDDESPVESVSPSVVDLIESWPLTAAYVQGRSLKILAANRLATRLWDGFTPGSCPLRSTFVDPAARSFFRDWEAATAVMVPFLRAEIGSRANDPDMAELVSDLLEGSDRFRTLWQRQDVKHAKSGLLEFQHPLGPLDLYYERLHLTDSLDIVTYHAEPGSHSHELLETLAFGCT